MTEKANKRNSSEAADDAANRFLINFVSVTTAPNTPWKRMFWVEQRSVCAQLGSHR